MPPKIEPCIDQNADVKSTNVPDTSMDGVLDEIVYSDDTILSRTLKRKFTELEEITERLRARLFDVTGDADFDPDDQFENDLNTLPDEDDDLGINGNDDFDWLKMCREQEKSIDEIDLFTGKICDREMSVTDVKCVNGTPESSTENDDVLSEALITAVSITDTTEPNPLGPTVIHDAVKRVDDPLNEGND